MDSRKDALLAIRTLRNALLFKQRLLGGLSVKEKLLWQCGQIEEVIGKDGQLWDSADLPDPLFPSTSGHALGIIPTESDSGLVVSLTGTKKIVGTVDNLSDGDAVAAQLCKLTGAKEWRRVDQKRRRSFS